MDENVVSTPFSADVTDFEALIYVESGPDAFARAVLDALEDDERRAAVRESIAVPNDWNAKAREFCSLLLRLAGRKD
jgi:hypothetical protein